MQASMPAPQDPSLPMSTFGEFDYTFTDKELEDVLGFMERQHGRGGGDSLQQAPPMQFLGTGRPPASLQFQPHLPANAPLHPPRGVEYDYMMNLNMYPEHGRESPFLPPSASPGPDMKLEYLDSPPAVGAGVHMTPFVPGELVGAGSMVRGGSGVPARAESRMAGNGSGVLSRAAPRPGGASSAGSPGLGSGISPDTRPRPGAPVPGKPHVSHSTVEKQRRDRINALIDELRDLVPPSGAADGASDAADSRRPKHVVLADTIQLVRTLRDRLSSAEIGRGRGASSSALSAGCDTHSAGGATPGGGTSVPGFGGDACVEVAAHEPSTVSQRSTDSHPELPQAPADNTGLEEGVVVEAMGDVLYVKVHCQDRPGLLSDVVRTLKQVPLAIKTAAVTTTANGMVCDVFQARQEPGQAVSLAEVQRLVAGVVFDEPAATEKKRRGTSLRE